MSFSCRPEHVGRPAPALSPTDGAGRGVESLHFSVELTTMTMDRTPAANPVTFILIDDNDGIRDLTAALVEDTPYVKLVGEASGALEGLALVQSVQPDVVLLDISMPGVSGLDVLPELLKTAPYVKVLMYSAHEGMREDALSRGAHGWVAKGTPWSAMADEMVRAASCLPPGA